MRPVGRKVNQALQAGVDKANFGLCFNKWIELEDRGRDRFKPKDKGDPKGFVSLYNRCCLSAAPVRDNLEKRQLQQSRFCEFMSNIGWTPAIVTAELKSPFVTGLGMTHPTETGMVLDWTLGVPYVPATSLKGVFRFSFILSDAENAPERVENGVWQAGDDFFALFGRTAEKGGDEGLCGGIVVLDAYPLKAPKLGTDILNPHYPQYYRNAERGPTEDQNPVPVKFLVVEPGARFVFRILVSERRGQDAVDRVKDVLMRALEEEGLGAKTALGYGRFKIVNHGEPAEIKRIKEDEDAKKYPWKPILKRIEKVANWGDLKQLVLDSEEIAKWKDRQDILEAVRKAALRVRQIDTKKWIEKGRDKLVSKWFEGTSVTWEVLKKESEDESKKDAPVTLVEKIRALADWKDYKNSGIRFEELDLIAAQALLKRFKKWGCDKKKAKKQKKQAFKDLKRLVSKLKKG